MEKEKVVIQEVEAPGLRVDVNGVRYELLCEYQAQNGVFQKVFIEESTNDVMIEVGKSHAIVGVFSAANDRVRKLFDYIEASVDSKDGFVCWQEGEMERHLERAIALGGKYPLIQKGIGLTDKVPVFYRQRPVDKGFLRQVEDKKADVEHVDGTYEEDLEDAVLHPAPDEEFLMAPKLTQAETLPVDWFWVDYHDGSGHLESPEGERYFHYDRGPGSFGGGVEYYEKANEPWRMFPGSFEEFQKVAEETILDNVLENVGGQKGMYEMDFYVIDDLKQGVHCQYFEDAASALGRFQEVVRDERKMPALGVRVNDGAMDLLHGVQGEVVLVPEYKNDKLKFSDAMQDALPAIRDVVAFLVVENRCGLYEYQNGLVPGWLQADVKVLVPTSLDDAGIAGDSYLADKQLRAEKPNGLDAIDSVHMEMHGWVSYAELLRHPNEYCAGGVIKITQVNVNYVNHKGEAGQMDIAPHEFKLMQEKLGKISVQKLLDDAAKRYERGHGGNESPDLEK